MSNDVSTVSSWANPSDNCLRKAQTIVQEDLIQELNDVSYLVKSNTSGVIYGVDINSSGIYSCQCKSCEHRGFCSHIEAVKIVKQGK